MKLDAVHLNRKALIHFNVNANVLAAPRSQLKLLDNGYVWARFPERDFPVMLSPAVVDIVVPSEEQPEPKRGPGRPPKNK